MNNEEIKQDDEGEVNPETMVTDEKEKENENAVDGDGVENAD